MKLKKCFKCKIEKELSEFYKHYQMKDGHVNKCKECNKKDVQNNYRKNIEYYTAYEKKRNALSHRVEARREYQKNNKEKVNSCKLKWSQNNKHKVKAHLKVKRAIEKGLLTRPLFCQNCKKETYTEAHHKDYNFPLRVEWLCKKCHTERHWGGKQ